MYSLSDYFFTPTVDRKGFHDGTLKRCPLQCLHCKEQSCRNRLNHEYGIHYSCNYTGFVHLDADVTAIGVEESSERVDAILTIDEDRKRVDICSNQLQKYIFILDCNPSEQTERAPLFHTRPETEISTSIRIEAMRLCRLNGENDKILDELTSFIKEKYFGISLTDKLLKIPPHIHYAYWGTLYLQGKLKLLQLVIRMDRLYHPYLCTPLRIAGIISRQLEIFSNRFRDKKLTYQLNCSNYKLITAAPDAISALSHAILDNAFQYSPEQEEITINIIDCSDGVKVEFISAGSRYDDDESLRLTEAGYRGRRVAGDGSGRLGIGLYAVALICRIHLGSTFHIAQSPQTQDTATVTCTVKIPDRAIVIL